MFDETSQTKDRVTGLLYFKKRGPEMQPMMGKPIGVVKGGAAILMVLVVVVGVVAVLTGLISGPPALALQALSSNEMESVVGGKSIHIGIGEGFPFSGNAGSVTLEPDGSTYFIDFIDRPDSAGDDRRPSFGTTWAYDRYDDEFAMAFCNFDPDVYSTTDPLPAAKILVPLEIVLDVVTGSANKPMLKLEVFTEYSSWPAGNVEPDFYFDMMSFRKNVNTVWYNDTTWEAGFELHVDGITFLSYPYHDVDDNGITPDGTGGNTPNTITPANHIILGSQNSESGLVGEMGMKLHLPGVALYSAPLNSANERKFGIEGILLAGNIAQASWSDELDFDPDLADFDFDGEFIIGQADSTAYPGHPASSYNSNTATARNDTFSSETPDRFPLTISPVIWDVPGTEPERAFLVIEGCGGRSGTVDFAIANLSTTPGAHPYYGGTSGTGGGPMDTAYREYMMGDIRVGHIYSVLDRDNNSATPPTTAELGKQAVVLNDINVPYFKAVLCIDGQLGDILDSANGTAMTMIENTCMNNNAAVIDFGTQVGYSDIANHDKVTDPPAVINWSSSGTWYTPCPGYTNIWK